MFLGILPIMVLNDLNTMLYVGLSFEFRAEKTKALLMTSWDKTQIKKSFICHFYSFVLVALKLREHFSA